MTTTITILDGGMGRELARRGAPFRQPEWSALALYEAPTAVWQVHTDFISSGADVITTNSYAVVPFHIGADRFVTDAATLATLAGKLAVDAKENAATKGISVQVAGSLPPLFGSYRADLFEVDKVASVAQPLIDSLSPYVDFWLCETQSAIIEPQSVARLLPDDRPLWVSFTLIDDEPSDVPRLRSGETVADAAAAMIALGSSAMLFNCCQPEVINDAIAHARTVIDEAGSDMRLGAYANAFPPQPKDATANDGLDEVRADLTPAEYLTWAIRWVDNGASIIGGCCGIGPEYITALAKQFK